MMRLAAALVLLAAVDVVSAQVTQEPTSFCRSQDGSTAALNDLKMTVDSSVNTVRGLVDRLRREGRIPLSFIEIRAGESLTLKAVPNDLDGLLREVARQHSGYRCEIYGGRLVLRDGAEELDTVISGVQVADAYRIAGLVQYLDHLQSHEEFSDWVLPLRGGNLDSPLFTEKITLTPRAPLVEHLVQLLGTLDSAYFDVPAAGRLPRTVRITKLP